MIFGKEKYMAGFSIIEVMIGIFVFSLGMVSIYALLASSLRINDYNKNAIIASNLAREQIELVRNIRDTNYKQYRVWNKIDGSNNIADGYYTASQDFNNGAISITPISDFGEGQSELGGKMLVYQLCLDAQKRYVYCSASATEKTPFFKYLLVSPAKDDSGVDIPSAYEITSKVIWSKRGYYDFEIQTLITDWRRI